MAARRGRERINPDSGRRWRVSVLEGKRPRVVYLDPETGKRTSRSPAPGQSLDDLFDQVEKALDARVVLSQKDPTTSGVRDMRALAARYIQWLETQGRAHSYIEKVDHIIKRWVLPSIGDLPVKDWGPEESQAIISAVRAAGLSSGWVEQVGVALSGLRKTAWRRSGGVAWLPRTEDPLEGVGYSRTSAVSGQHRDYVEPARRPTLAQVQSAIAAARIRDAKTGNHLALQIQIAAFCGLRLGEQMALRAVDVHLEDRELSVNGSWAQPRLRDGVRVEPFRKTTKTKMSRRTPYPASMHSALVVRCAEALGLPADTAEADVIAAQKAARSAGSDNEAWLVPCAATGRPYTKEGHNDEWHRVVRLTKTRAKAGEGVEWPRTIEYMNLRHHAATWWHNDIGLAWEEVALFLGNDIATCLAHYVRAASDSADRARAALANV
jgi:integrase